MGKASTVDGHSPMVSVSPQNVTAPLNGSAVDHTGFAAAAILISLGAFGGTSPTATIKVQDSPDNSTWTDVTAANLGGGGVIPQITAANANTMIRRSYLGLQRWVRVIVSAVGGTTPSLPMCAIVLLDLAEIRPTAASAV